MLELYNTTNDVKRIPKYKYNGKFVIPPHGSVKIEDEQAYFFKPYARVGIVVRKIPSEPIPVASISEPEEKDKKAEIPISVQPVVETIEEPGEMETVGSIELETEPIEEPETEEEPVVEELPEKHTVTAEELAEMTIKELREVAKELNIDIHGMRKKDDIRAKIIENI